MRRRLRMRLGKGWGYNEMGGGTFFFYGGKPIVFLSTGICKLWLDRYIVVDRLCWPAYSVRFLLECDMKLKRFVCILSFWRSKQANAV